MLFFSHCVFFLYISPFFSLICSLFNSLAGCCRSLRLLKPILSHPRPFIFVLFCPAALCVCLFITQSSCLCLLSLVSPPLLHFVWYSSCFSSHPHEPDLPLFYLSSSSGWGSSRFRCSLLFFPSLNAAALTQSKVSLAAFQLFEFLSLCPL